MYAYYISSMLLLLYTIELRDLVEVTVGSMLFLFGKLVEGELLMKYQ